MGSVIDHIECPNCKQEAYSDFYYKTGEENIFCDNCGYIYSSFWKRDENGELITKDGTDNHSFDNLTMDVHSITNPYGAYRLKVYQDVGYQCGTIKDEEQYNNFKTTSEVDVEIEFCSISRLIDGNIVNEIIIDNRPK